LRESFSALSESQLYFFCSVFYLYNRLPQPANPSTPKTYNGIKWRLSAPSAATPITVTGGLASHTFYFGAVAGAFGKPPTRQHLGSLFEKQANLFHRPIAVSDHPPM